MINKIKQAFSNPTEGQQQLFGLVLLIFVCLLCYSVGRGDGAAAEREQLPDNARIEAKLDKIIKATEANPACAATMLEAAR